MAKADDSSIEPEALRAVHIAARRALDRASAWGVYPTPTPVILEAANLRIGSGSFSIVATVVEPSGRLVPDPAPRLTFRHEAVGDPLRLFVGHRDSHVVTAADPP